jgi:hypothetical protein
MAKRKAHDTLGFGFDPTQSAHHFAFIADPATGNVAVEERFTWDDATGNAGDQEAIPEATVKAILDAYRWARIAPTVAETFNARLRTAGLPTSTWSGESLLAPHLGKELTLLFWAIEDADPTLLPTMLANWKGLAPEERWWLYTTVNATSGHPEHGRDRGWRKAIKIAFAENPVAPATPSALLAKTPASLTHKRHSRRRPGSALPQVETDQLTLF